MRFSLLCFHGSIDGCLFLADIMQVLLLLLVNKCGKGAVIRKELLFQISAYA